MTCHLWQTPGGGRRVAWWLHNPPCQFNSIREQQHEVGIATTTQPEVLRELSIEFYSALSGRNVHALIGLRLIPPMTDITTKIMMRAPIVDKPLGSREAKFGMLDVGLLDEYASSIIEGVTSGIAEAGKVGACSLLVVAFGSSHVDTSSYTVKNVTKCCTRSLITGLGDQPPKWTA